MIKSNPEIELAWVAGFIDGEGTIRFRGDKDKVPATRSRSYGCFTIQAAQTDRGVLDRLHAALGVGKVYGPYGPYTTQKFPFHAFSAAGREAMAAYQRFRPYLSSIKRAQGDRAYTDYKKQLDRPKLGNGLRRRRYNAAHGIKRAA